MDRGAKMSLEFQKEGHIYKYDGRIVPSVTQVLEPLVDYSMVPSWRLDLAAERGTYVHKLIELYEFETLDEYDQELKPYLDAWIQFLADTGFVSDLIEYRVYHPQYKYAGQIDRIGHIRKKMILIDVKTTAIVMPSVGPQVAAYREAWASEAYQIDERWVVQLKPDGTYRRETLRGSGDFSTFLACLNIHKFKVKHNEI